MLGGIINRIFVGASAPSTPGRLPPELVAAIAAASVVFRPSRGADGAERVSVTLPTVGAFAFDGIREAAEIIGRAWPEITPAQARHAAHLLAGEVGRRSYLSARGLLPARVPKCLQFRESDYDRL